MLFITPYSPRLRQRRECIFEDLFLKPEKRRSGLGTKFFSEVEKFVKQDGFSYIEWSCLDWNGPAINFYNKIGAEEEHGRRYFSYSL